MQTFSFSVKGNFKKIKSHLVVFRYHEYRIENIEKPRTSRNQKNH